MPARIRSAHCACWNCRRDRSATEPEPEPFSGHSYRRRAHNRFGDPTPLPQTATSGTPQQVQHSDSPLASHDASAGYLAVRDPDVGGAGGVPTVCPVRDLGEGVRVRHDVRGAGRPDHRVHDRPVLAEFWSIPYLDSRAGQDDWGRMTGAGCWAKGMPAGSRWCSWCLDTAGARGVVHAFLPSALDCVCRGPRRM